MNIRWNSFLKWQRQTVGRDLMVRLMWVLTFGVVVTVALDYYYSVNRDKQALIKKANTTINDLAAVMKKGLWDVDHKWVNDLAESYIMYDYVTDIYVTEKEEYIVKPKSQSSKLVADFTLYRQITYDGNIIGTLYMDFTYNPYKQRQMAVLIKSLLVFLLAIILLLFTVKTLMNRFLSVHLNTLDGGLATIAGGNYNFRMDQAHHGDLNKIGEMVNKMAFEISRRENRLEENQGRLELLNQSIMSIFSSTTVDELVRTSLSILMDVSKSLKCWFLMDENFDQESFFGAIESNQYIFKEGISIKTTEKIIINEMSEMGQDKNLYTIPIQFEEQTFGKITVAFVGKQDLSVESMLKSIASLISMALEKQCFIHESALISTELAVAETIQQSVLPDQYSKLKNANVDFYLKPVLRIGGDWFSVIESEEGRFLYLIIADVTGHGIAQGLVTTAVAGAMHNIESDIKSFDKKPQDMITPSKIITQFDGLIEKISGKSNLNMTCVVARFDFEENKLTFCNAGHRHPLILGGVSQKQVQTLLGAQGEILGTDVAGSYEHTYQDSEYSFSDQSKFIFYTDGLVEAENLKGEPFLRKFNRQLKKIDSELDSKSTLNAILDHFEQHSNEVMVNDDVCLVVVSKKEKQAKPREVLPVA